MLIYLYTILHLFYYIYTHVYSIIYFYYFFLIIIFLHSCMCIITIHVLYLYIITSYTKKYKKKKEKKRKKKNENTKYKMWNTRYNIFFNLYKKNNTKISWRMETRVAGVHGDQERGQNLDFNSGWNLPRMERLRGGRWNREERWSLERDPWETLQKRN